MLKYLRLCLLQVVVVSTALAGASASKQRVYIQNAGPTGFNLKTLDLKIYVDVLLPTQRVETLAHGEKKVFANFKTLQYLTETGGLKPIITADKMFERPGLDLHVVFTYERPHLRGHWVMNQSWYTPQPQESLEEGWVDV